MLTLAKMCQDNSDYTDCVIQCGDFSSDDTEEDHERNRYETQLYLHQNIFLD